MTGLRRALFVLCAVALTWALALGLFGGFSMSVGLVRLSSRNPTNPYVIALLSALSAIALTLKANTDARRADWVWVRRWFGWIRWAPSATTLAALGIAVRIYEWQINRPLWLDEEMIALNVRDRSMSEFASPLWLGQSAPFGWLALQRAIVTTVGTSEYALRAVPLVFGVATVLLALWAGRRWLHGVAASVVVLMCSFALWLTHYSLEVKHFSADAFFGLFLPVVAVWVVETPSPMQQMRRGAIWCGAAAVGHWFANGAALAAPGCALVLLFVFWRRGGWRSAAVFAGFASVWVASFAIHYWIAIRHSLNSDYLRTYWASGLVPAGIGWGRALHWLVASLEPLAVNPIGSHFWILLWISAACGFVFASRRLLGVILAVVPLSAFTLAALRLVPLVDRLSLWMVPALLFGVALFVDRGVSLAGAAYRHHSRWFARSIAAAMLVVGFAVCYDLVATGIHALRFERPRDSKQGIDDRSAVRWLMMQHRRGDLLVTTHLGLPALWWYGGASISKGDMPGGRLPDGSAIMELGYAAAGAECRGDRVGEIAAAHRRVLVYFGFPDRPDQFENLVFNDLMRVGRVTARRDFSLNSHAAIVDIGASDEHRATDNEKLDGCVVVRPAMRW